MVDKVINFLQNFGVWDFRISLLFDLNGCFDGNL